MLAVSGALSFREQLAWLANVLASRGYPLGNLADNLETAAETTRQLVTSSHTEQLVRALEMGAQFIRELTYGDSP